MLQEEISILTENEIESEIKKAIKEIHEKPEYKYKIFHVSKVYFAISNDKIYEILDDASCSPKGGWFPDIVYGMSEDKRKYIETQMKIFKIDETFFGELFNWYDADITQENVIEYFEEQDDAEALSTAKELLSVFNDKENPFKTLYKFLKAFGMCDLEEDMLYYEWEGMYIDFYDNICDTGEARGEYESLSSAEWLYILTNIDDYIVHADYEI